MKRSGFKKKPIEEILAKKREKASLVRKVPKKRSKVAKQPSQRQLKDKLWAECKRIIRQRYGNGDGTFTCYTCGAHLDTPAKAQTGHFIPSSICSVEMRYSLDNLRIQDYRCNINLSGNWPAYEKKLKQEMGEHFPDELKERNEATKNKQYDRLWYLAKIEEYKKL